MQRVLPVVLVSLATLVGCRTTEVADPSASTVTSMEQFQSELGGSKIAVNSTVAVLNQLGSDDTKLVQQFKSLTRNITGLEEKAKIVRGMRQDMDAHEEVFMKEWKGKLMRIANDDLRQQATDRRDETKTMFDELEVLCDTARQTFDPWIRELNDVRTYL